MRDPEAPISTFLSHGAKAEPNALASIHLRRDLQVPIILREKDEDNEGYDEGKVTNTRFGSFPHSTLIGVPWGSQVKASAVDTGSRGRRSQNNLKRKRGTQTEASTPEHNSENTKAAKDASSGFAHLFAPTPETWTYSLPHRTQVVYTPDYSYILQRIRARPGTVLIEAGAGSGSFTHASVRAVFNGFPSSDPDNSTGKVFSFEFHEARFNTLTQELSDHGLKSLVKLTLRDVCEDGFQLPPLSANEGPPSVQATAVFLDLPAPWLALPHLTRNSGASKSTSSPLNPFKAIYICTFSPCIEQVQRTVTALRVHGWTEIEMVEISAKRLEVRREYVGLQEEGLRGTNATPATIEESLGKLRYLEKRGQIVQAQAISRTAARKAGLLEEQQDLVAKERDERAEAGLITKQDRLQSIKNASKDRKLHMEGRLTHRAEPEIRTHTSYLVFAILPRSWSAEDERSAQLATESAVEINKGKSKKQLKKEARLAKVTEAKT